MSTNPIRVLLVTQQSQEQSAIPGLLSQLDNREFILADITRPKTALERLTSGDCDAFIIDLPQAEAVVLLSKARRLLIPFLALLIIVDDAGQDLEAIRAGAAGCLVRGNLTVQSLERELLLLTNRMGSVQALQRPLQRSEERYRRINVQLVIENGEVDELQALGRDITSRKRIEQQLYDSEQRYRQLFVANPHPTWVYDLETLSFLTVNDAAIESYGYSLEAFLSMTIADIRPPEERQRFADSYQTGAAERYPIPGNT